MMSDWKLLKLSDIAEFNPRESLAKGTVAKKIAMDKLQPFTRDVPEYELESYSGGTKFRNGDTIMARITPCLENGKTSKVTILDENEVGFGSTEFIVFRAKDNVDADYLYYLICSSLVREPAIKSMVGSSGRQRVQTDVVQNLELYIPDTNTQIKIGKLLKDIDDKILCNKKTNQNLYEQARSFFRQWVSSSTARRCSISDIATINSDTYSPKDNWEYVNYLDTSSINNGLIGEIQTIRPSEEKLPSRARRILKQGDIVYSTVRPNQLHYGIIANPLPNMLGSTGFAVIRSKDNSVSNEIIYLALTEPSFIEQMQQLAEQSVSTFPSIKPSDLDACTIPLPSEEDDAMIATIRNIFALTSINDEENKQLALLRDTLLPKLMSGELDISELEI